MKLHSRLLGEDIICVEDGQKSHSEAGIVTYTRSELAALKGLDAEAVRAVHKAKKHFGGTYVGPSPTGR